VLASAGADLQSIGSAVAVGSSAAAAPTTGVEPAAAGEVATLAGAHFAGHAASYQEVSAQAAAIHELFVRTLGSSAESYEVTESANAIAAR